MSVCPECGTGKFDDKEHESHFMCGCWLLEDSTPMPQAACRVIKELRSQLATLTVERDELRAKWEFVCESASLGILESSPDPVWTTDIPVVKRQWEAKSRADGFRVAVEEAMKVKQ